MNGNGRRSLFNLPGCHSMIQIHIEPVCKIFGKNFAHITGNARYAALMQIDHSRFPVRVGIHFLPCADNPLRVFLEIGVRNEACRIRCGAGKQFVHFTDRLLPLILLQDDEVAAHFRPGMVGEEIVRQTDG